jgi:hypothetical protein
LIVGVQPGIDPAIFQNLSLEPKPSVNVIQLFFLFFMKGQAVRVEFPVELHLPLNPSGFPNEPEYLSPRQYCKITSNYPENRTNRNTNLILPQRQAQISICNIEFIQK